MDIKLSYKMCSGQVGRVINSFMDKEVSKLPKSIKFKGQRPNYNTERREYKFRIDNKEDLKKLMKLSKDYSLTIHKS